MLDELTSMQEQVYEKHHSFGAFYSRINASPKLQRNRAIKILWEAFGRGSDNEYNSLLLFAVEDLENNEVGDDPSFGVTPFIADEMSRIDDEDLPRYLFYRYRYDIYPQRKVLDAYPPYIQIEASSRCNFRCVFCYQTDESLSGRSSPYMGFMKFPIFKRVVDEITGHVEFGSISSRGEPLLCPDINKMVEYCNGKFLGMKLNTNASLLTEALAHSILSGGIGTVVFSIDAAEPQSYQRYRRGGSFEKVFQNVNMFESVRRSHYPRSRIISRVSGVQYDQGQQLEPLVNKWSDCVDQVAFVRYNPWENVYEREPSSGGMPCSDLWRRMFVWHDGIVNPCDSDYKSTLAIGSVQDKGISEIWTSESYRRLREQHLSFKRSGIEPCRRCAVV